MNMTWILNNKFLRSVIHSVVYIAFFKNIVLMLNDYC
jgi:hypothetical protein